MPRSQPEIAGSVAVAARIDAPLVGMALAREAKRLLVWDARQRLYVLDRQGAITARKEFDRRLLSAAISDDGSTVVALPDREEVCWLEPDLSERFRYRALPKGRVVALDSTGWHVAVAASTAQNVIADCEGRRLAAFRTARPVSLLEFPCDDKSLVTCGEGGPLANYDLDGDRVWQNQLLGRYEGLAVFSGGVLLASAASGLFVFDQLGRSRGTLLRGAPPLRVSASFDGAKFLVGRESGEASLIDPRGKPLWNAAFDAPVVDVRLDLLGASAWIALADGRLVLAQLAE